VNWADFGNLIGFEEAAVEKGCCPGAIGLRFAFLHTCPKRKAARSAAASLDFNPIENAGRPSVKQLAVQSEMAMGEVAQRAGRLFLRLSENKLRSGQQFC
jgi:hypothetical protein